MLELIHTTDDNAHRVEVHSYNLPNVEQVFYRHEIFMDNLLVDANAGFSTAEEALQEALNVIVDGLDLTGRKDY